MLTVDQKTDNYKRQNNGGSLTIPQRRQLRKTETRLAHTDSHNALRLKQLNLRTRFREWMAGIR